MPAPKVVTADAYALYKANMIEAKQRPLMPKPFYTVIDSFLKYMMDKLFEGHDIYFGDKLGFIGIRCRKVVPRISGLGEVCGVAPSWAKTKILWEEKAAAMGLTFKEYVAQVPKKERQLVYCFNEHSNGLKYGLMWFKRDATAKNKVFYNLIFCRKAKRRLSKAVRAGAEYMEVKPKVPRGQALIQPATLHELNNMKHVREPQNI